jgi:hypothetical protein
MHTQENQAATDTKDPEDTLDPRQVQAIDLLVQGWTTEAVAKKIGVSARSIRRWKHQAEFAGELREIIGEVLDNAQLRINPLILRAERQANRSFRINDEMLESTDYTVVSKACNHASNNAIKWIKLLLVLRKAEATQNLTCLANSLGRIGEDSAVASAQSTPSTQSTQSTQSTVTTSGGEVSATDSVPRVDAKSGQKRTSEAAPVSVQPPPAESIKPAATPPKPVSAPAPARVSADTAAKPADSLTQAQADNLIAEVTAEVVMQQRASSSHAAGSGGSAGPVVARTISSPGTRNLAGAVVRP